MTNQALLLVNGASCNAQAAGSYQFGTSDFSAECLVQSTVPVTLIEHAGTPVGAGPGETGFSVSADDDGTLRFSVFDGSGRCDLYAEPTSALDGDWHHVAAVRRGLTLELYFDGTQAAEATCAQDVNVDTDSPVAVGSARASTGGSAVILDDVALWSRALSVSEIIDGMFERISPAAPGLAACWPLNGSLQDISPAGNDLSAAGDTAFVPVNHWSALDFGADLTAGGSLRAASIAQYNAGTGDFTAGGFVQSTSPGTVMSRGAASGAGNGGFRLTLEPQGVVKIFTSDGTSYLQAQSDRTPVLDGSWHHVVATRSSGALAVLIDGWEVPVAVTGTAAGSLSIDNTEELILGSTDQSQEPYQQLPGWIADICFWRTAIGRAELDKWRFSQLTGAEPHLAACYELDGDGKDSSVNRNNATPDSLAKFGVIFMGLQTTGANSYSYCAITSDPPPPVLAARGIFASGSLVRRQQTVEVQFGAPVLIAAVNAPVDGVAPPPGLILSIIDPAGRSVTSARSPNCYVSAGESGSVGQLVVTAPMAGLWTVVVEAPPTARFQCQVTAIPAQAVGDTIKATLAVVYPEGNANVLTMRPRGTILMPGISWGCFWCQVGAWALAIIVVAVILAIFGAATSGIGPAIVALAAFLGWMATSAAAALFALGAVVGTVAAWLCYWISQCDAPTPSAPSLQTIVNNIVSTVGDPARFGARATRQNAGIDAAYPITTDIGGEGQKPWDGSPTFHNLVVGFANAININDKVDTTGGPPTRAIPLLVKVAAWPTDPGLPLADGFANYITMQNCPLTDTGQKEMARTLARGGKIGLWIDTTVYAKQIGDLAAALNTTPVYNAPDEFDGKAGHPKTLIVDHR